MRICLQKYFIILFPILTGLLISLAHSAYEVYSCIESEGNYTNNSTYQSNFNALLASIPSHIDEYGFGNYSVGRSPDTTYSLSLCRGDKDIKDCRSCIRQAIVNSTQACGNHKEAIWWNEFCTLSYSSNSLYGKLRENPFGCLLNVKDSPGSGEFNHGSLMADLRAEAAGGYHRKFSTGQVTGDDNMPIFGLMQCTPDLSKEECNDCLTSAMARTKTCSRGKAGMRILLPSCNVRYESVLFYGDTAGPRDAPPPSISTVETGTNNTRVQNESCTVDEIMIVESLQYDFSTIATATDNFCDSNKLGRGGFGIVYKGVLPDGTIIAVKRLSENSHQGEAEFKNEVVLVAKLQHRNLVRLLGFCYKQSERLLIYEFMTNSSLDQFLFDPVKSTALNWDKRYKIIGGIARGLLYLHEDSRLRIIHRDLKSSNVLLDNEMNPKISDFGMARLFVMDEATGCTNRIVGTYGYMAPEYATHGYFSVKSDVFSFGVLILEIVSGQKNSYFRKGEIGEDLLTFAWNSWRQERALDLVDHLLMSSTNSTWEIMRCIHIGLLSVQQNPIDRPTMAQVVLMLTSMSLNLPEPSEPAIFLQSNEMMPLLRERESQFIHSSGNEASITELSPR